jgi:hypothetical protein
MAKGKTLINKEGRKQGGEEGVLKGRLEWPFRP